MCMWSTPYSVWKRVTSSFALLASLFSEKREDPLDMTLQTCLVGGVAHANFNEEITPPEWSRVPGMGHSHERVCKI